MRVLVTGGAGFIGSGVVRRLLGAGHDVTIVDAGLPQAHGPDPASAVHGIPVIAADLRRPDALDDLLGGVDAVCHQAAMVGLGVDLQDLPLYAGHNDLATAALLAAMARHAVPRLVLAGSMVIYGEGRYTCPEHAIVPAGPRRADDLARGRFEPRCPRCDRELAPALVPEDAPADPRNGYAVSKLAQELYAQTWARETGGSLVVLRYHNVYGPGMPRDTPYAGVASIFRSAIERGEAPRVFEDGGQRRDFVHADDVATANLAALQAQQDGELPPGTTVLNIGSGEPRTVLDLARGLTAALGGEPPVVTGEFRLGDVRHVTADTARARSVLGWLPRTGFDHGIAELARARLRPVRLP